MDNITIQKAGNLETPAREWLHRLFGRSLLAEEEVTILVLPPHSTPSTDQRRVAMQRMEQVLDKSAEQMKNVSDTDFDEAVDEAMEQVRKRQPWCERLSTPMFSTDPDDDPIIATAGVGKADVICTLDRHFRQQNVQSYCSQHAIRIVTDLELLKLLREQGDEECE